MPRSGSSKIPLLPAAGWWELLLSWLPMLCYLCTSALFCFVLSRLLCVEINWALLQDLFAEESLLFKVELTPSFVAGDMAVTWLSTVCIHHVLTHEKSITIPLKPLQIWQLCSVTSYYWQDFWKKGGFSPTLPSYFYIFLRKFLKRSNM